MKWVIIVEGIYLIDKKTNMTSYDVIRVLKKKLNVTKIGHTGTLDPFASGLLIILTGRTTKLSDYLLNDDKTYTGEITFGYSTDTYDLEGKIVNKLETFNIREVELNNAFKSLTGKITQIPPIYSAIKVDGKKLYDYARANNPVEIMPREVNVMEFRPTGILSDNKISFLASVSKGTYIRSLAHDLGKQLNIPSHLSSLRRIRSGNFNVNDAYRLDSIDENTKPTMTLTEFAESLDKVIIKPYLEKLILNGIYLDSRQTSINKMFSVYTEDNRLIAIYTPQEDKYKPLIILGE
jgi:tRNA pseudouridine55 synthase